MSRCVVFGLDGMALGEFTATCNRGWTLLGARGAAGGTASVLVSRETFARGLLQPGRIVLIQHDKLPAWAGVIDTDIGLLPPHQVSLYNIEYLLQLRVPEAPASFTGTAAKIAEQMIALANAPEELFVRLGIAGGSPSYREETLDQRAIWEQLAALAKRAGVEIVMRPERNASDSNRLYVYVDLHQRAGFDTDFLLVDGRNARVTNAKLTGQIWNRVQGINAAGAQTERLTTAPQVNVASAAAFRTRSRVIQVRTELASSLQDVTAQAVADLGTPRISFSVLGLDVGETFANLRPGNGLILHAPKVVLPDGRQGWRGTGRIVGMAYNERENTVGMTLEAIYDI